MDQPGDALAIAVLQSIEAPVVVLDAAGNVVRYNPACERLLGLVAEDVLGAPAWQVLSLPQERSQNQAIFESIRDTGAPTAIETRWRSPEGDLRRIEWKLSALRDGDGAFAYLVCTAADVTDRKKIERELEEARAALEARVRQRTAELESLKEAAEAADRAKSEFLNIASHELRTPLTALRLALQLGRRELRDGRTVDDRALWRMERCSNRLVRMATDLLQASRLERGVFQLHQRPVELRALLEGVVADFRLLAPAREVRLSLPEPVTVQGDPERLEQVFSNLLDNALKYTPAGAPVEVSLATDARHAIVRISDRGPGFEPEERRRLFTRFHRAPSRHHQPGLGLGLWVSHEIVGGHGGALELLEGDEGSTFVVTLPR